VTTQSPPDPTLTAAASTSASGAGHDLFAEIAARFVQCGAAGLVMVDTSPLEAVDRLYGAKIYGQMAHEIERKLHEVGAQHAPPDEIGRLPGNAHEQIALLFFRRRTDYDFYREALPAIAAELAVQMPRLCRRVLAPYLPDQETLYVGHALAMHNPSLQAERLIGKALLEAREAADLNRRNAALAARREFIEVLLTERVESIYEKIVHLPSCQVYGYEALVRGPWGTPLQGPAELFRMAEETDLVFELDCLCRQSALRGAVGRLPPAKKLFLNCLPSAIHDPNFKESALDRTLSAVGLHPRDVIFEISEAEAIKNYAIFREFRDHYRTMGFRFALDDTGTGYSSLSALMELSPDFIKIDRSIVKSVHGDPSRQVLLRALKSLADQLGARVIAEGVEVKEEFDTVVDLGIQFAQGFYFGRGGPLL
jgi:EAL domain-containing protein (putative c-di-GMP-specific phosphodiesterase class I)